MYFNHCGIGFVESARKVQVDSFVALFGFASFFFSFESSEQNWHNRDRERDTDRQRQKQRVRVRETEKETDRRTEKEKRKKERKKERKKKRERLTTNCCINQYMVSIAWLNIGRVACRAELRFTQHFRKIVKIISPNG
jgi:uncharacterized membrane protein YhiD involved in acid resistance